LIITEGRRVKTCVKLLRTFRSFLDSRNTEYLYISVMTAYLMSKLRIALWSLLLLVIMCVIGFLLPTLLISNSIFNFITGVFVFVFLIVSILCAVLVIKRIEKERSEKASKNKIYPLVIKFITIICLFYGIYSGMDYFGIIHDGGPEWSCSTSSRFGCLGRPVVNYDPDPAVSDSVLVFISNGIGNITLDTVGATFGGTFADVTKCDFAGGKATISLCDLVDSNTVGCDSSRALGYGETTVFVDGCDFSNTSGVIKGEIILPYINNQNGSIDSVTISLSIYSSSKNFRQYRFANNNLSTNPSYTDNNPTHIGPFEEFEDFSDAGLMQVRPGYDKVWTDINNGNASKEKIEEAYALIFYFIADYVLEENDSLTWYRYDIDCINNKETYECLFVYAIINGDESICNYFPYSRTIEYGSKYGPWVATYYYMDACIVQTRLFKNYLDAEDKIAFCKSFNNSNTQGHCETFTALKQNSRGQKLWLSQT